MREEVSWGFVWGLFGGCLGGIPFLLNKYFRGSDDYWGIGNDTYLCLSLCKDRILWGRFLDGNSLDN